MLQPGITRVLAGLGLVAVVSACVRIDDAPCSGVELTPRTWSSTISGSQLFLAHAPNLSDPRCTFSWVGGGIPPGQLIESDPSASSVRAVMSGLQGFFQLKATSVQDPSLYCIATISLSEFGFSFVNPIVYPGGDGDYATGDVGLTQGDGAPRGVSAIAVGPTSARAYVAFIRVDASGVLVQQQLEQYDQSEFLTQPNPTPVYVTTDTGFGNGAAARLTVDRFGNAYWIRNPKLGGTVGRVTASAASGSAPDFRDLSAAGSEVVAGSDLASDGEGRLYFFGRLNAGPACAESQNGDPELLRVTDLFGATPSTERLGVFDATAFSTIEVDPEGRLLIHTAGGLSRYVLRTSGGVVSAVRDGTFQPPQDFPPAPLRLAIDGGGSIYLARYSPTDQGVFRVLNDVGQVISVLGDGSSTSPDLDRVRGLAVTLDGRLAALDDVFVGAGNAAELVIITPDPLD